MNLKEVMQALIDGKVIVFNSGFFKIFNGKLALWGKGSKEWYLTAYKIDELACESSEISETDPEAEYKKSLETKYGTLGFPMNSLYIRGEGLTPENSKLDKFTEALQTLFELKAHPLSVAPVDYGKQFSIEPLDNGNIFIDWFSRSGAKFARISPCFLSVEDTNQAIKDIGEDRLISMFKVLQGVYDE